MHLSSNEKNPSPERILMNSEANQVDWRRRKAATLISFCHFANDLEP